MQAPIEAQLGAATSLTHSERAVVPHVPLGLLHLVGVRCREKNPGEVSFNHFDGPCPLVIAVRTAQKCELAAGGYQRRLRPHHEVSLAATGNGGYLGKYVSHSVSANHSLPWRQAEG